MFVFLILTVLALLVRFITKDSSPTLLLVILGVIGLNIGYINIIFISLLTDTMAYNEFKTGVKVEGVIMSAYTFQAKMGMGIGGALLGFIL